MGEDDGDAHGERMLARTEETCMELSHCLRHAPSVPSDFLVHTINKYISISLMCCIRALRYM